MMHNRLNLSFQRLDGDPAQQCGLSGRSLNFHGQKVGACVDLCAGMQGHCRQCKGSGRAPDEHLAKTVGPGGDTGPALWG